MEVSFRLKRKYSYGYVAQVTIKGDTEVVEKLKDVLIEFVEGEWDERFEVV